MKSAPPVLSEAEHRVAKPVEVGPEVERSPSWRPCAVVWLQRCRLLGVLGSVLLTLLAATELRAQVTFTVNNTSDAVDSVPDGVCETGPGNGICTLRAAVQEANDTVAADTIDIPAGTYTITISGNDDDASKGDLDITEDLTITGADEVTTIVDGGISFRCFHVLTGATATISGLTVQNCAGAGLGGGIYSQGALDLSAVTLASNSATSGGGIAGDATSSLTLTEVTLNGNSATNGGGVFQLGSAAGTWLTDVSLIGNAATVSGGGIYSETSGLALTGVTLSGNSANNGGGIFLKDSASTVTLTDVSLLSNPASNLGGGIYDDGSGLELSGVTLSGNTAKDGAGFYDDGNGFTQNLINVTVSGNSATSEGGGVYIASGMLTLTNVTFSGNSAAASKGGGIKQAAGSVQLMNTIVANSPIGDNCDGTITDNGNNLADDSTCGTIPSTLTGLDPTLADNGGPTLTHKLLTGSNALDAGSNPSCPATDQRLFARPFNVTCDIGAYEESNFDVVIDGDISEWDDGSGNDFCIDDQGGVDDWTTTPRLDLTKVCVASNQTDTVYLLLGFDDTSFVSESSACMLIDTDDPANGFIDFVVCATFDSGPVAVELYSCDDSLADGCGADSLVKTYTSGSDYFSSNTEIGPFGNADSFVELELPYADMGLAGGQVAFSSFISYPGKSFLSNPRDSIFDDGGEDYTARIAYDLDEGTATTTPVTLSFFRASGGGVFDWSTSTETGNLGFNLYAVGKKRLEKQNDELIPSLVVDSLEPQRYHFEASDGGGGLEADEFVLEDVDIEGMSRFHGPFTLNEAYGSEAVDELETDWRRIRQQRALGKERRARRSKKSHPRRSGFPRVQLRVDTDGLYRVTHEHLLAAGFDFSRAGVRELALTNRGQAVPIHVVGSGLFGPGSYIEFLGAGLDTLYTRTNVYTLRVDSKAAVRVEQNRTPVRRNGQAGRTPDYYMETQVVETNRAYSFAAPTDDPWYDRRMLAISRPVETTLDLELDEHVVGVAPVELEVSLWGVTDFPRDPDHHVVIDVNGTEIADERFDGLADHPVTAEIPAYALSATGNTLRLRLPHDTGAQFDLVNYDHFRVTYPRRFVARNGGLTFNGQARAFRVNGLPSAEVVVYRVTDGIPELLRSTVSTGELGDSGNWAVTFPGGDEAATYHVSSGDSVLVPGLVEAPIPSPITNGEAELLIVAHPDFLEGLTPLVAARRSQGLSVRVVDVEEIYAQFSWGVFDPEAIREYLTYAYANMGTRSVLLVGGDTYDYRDHLGLGSISFVPTLYAQTDSIVRYAPVDPLYGDVDRDGIPDLSIGRFPVRTTDELAAVVEKTLVYERRKHGGVVLAADRFDATASYSFVAASEAMAANLPSAWLVERAYMDDLGLIGARELLLRQINEGTDLVSYFGHSGPSVWSFEGLLRSADADLLENSGRPIVVTQWGCWNTYYVSPSNDGLGQRLLLGANRGAAAVLGSATLTDADHERALGRYFFKHLTNGAPLGDVILGAKKDLAETHPGATDVLLGWTLLGDPTLSLVP